METEEIWGNISKHLTGESTGEQEKTVGEWTTKSKTNLRILNSLKEIWSDNPLKAEDTSEIYRKVNNRISHYSGGATLHRITVYGLRIAAMLFFLVGISILVKFYVLPDSSLVANYNEVSVPKGNRSFIVLPDSTKVWISNSTSLKYPSRFSGKAREIFLTGEAYFEVTHNEHKPFIVNIGKNRVKVLGTKFSVTAYPDDAMVKADLISGKIQFDVHLGGNSETYKSYIVTPGHSIEYNQLTKSVSDQKISGSFYDYWLKGIYTFKDESLESLAKKVERIYNVKIVFENNYLKSKRYNGSFSVDDNIFNFIEAIRQTSVEPVEYRLDGNKLFINLKK